MKIVFWLFVMFFSMLCAGQENRIYFFDDSVPVNDSTALISIVRDPKTLLAKELNYRIYTDTSFIRKLKDTCYVVVEGGLGKGRTYHECGYDMQFYILSGTKFTYYNHLNFACYEYDLGKGNINLFATSGYQLKVDTITRFPMSAYPEDYFTKDLIGFSSSGEIKQWCYTRNERFPDLYYDGYFKTSILLDSNFTINQNAENFVKTYTNNLEFINWNIPQTAGTKKFENDKQPIEVEIEVYLKKEDYVYFKSFKINPVDFEIPRGSELILIYKKVKKIKN